MTDETDKVIERRLLDNGMELVLYDRSRLMAGDRWLLDLECKMNLPIPESYWENLAEENPEMLNEIRNILGEKLVFTFNKERIFVEVEEREKQLQEMAQQVINSMLEYLSRPNFPIQLFKKQYKENRERLLIHRAMRGGADD